MDLRTVRFYKRLSQWELSRLSGIHQSRISLIENGHPVKDNEKLRLAQQLKVEPEEIEWPDIGKSQID